MNSAAFIRKLDELLGDHEGREPQLSWHCPFCAGRNVAGTDKKKLSVNTAMGKARCFRCDIRFASAVTLLRALGEEEADNFRFVGLDGEESFSPYMVLASHFFKKRESPNPQALKPVPLPEFSVPIWEDRNWNSPRFSKGVAYMKSRSVDQETAKRFELHYCVTGRYNRRIIAPIRQFGKIVNFTNREARQDSERKTLNAKAVPGYYSIGDCLLGFDRAIGAETVSIVEGLFDHIATPHSVATCGKTITPQQIELLELLALYGTKRFVVLRDSDAEGYPTYTAISARLPDVRIASLDRGDPHNNRERIADYIAAADEPTPTMLVRQRLRAMKGKL